MISQYFGDNIDKLYFNKKYPVNMGLSQTGLKIHNHKYKSELENLGNEIRHIMINYDIIRDQLIFNYICLNNDKTYIN